MGSTKDKRKRKRNPWELVLVRTRKGWLLHVKCSRCEKNTTVRYWDPARERAICIECVPSAVRPFLAKQSDSPPEQRPMALG